MTSNVVLRDVIDVLNRQGIYKLIILNSHGGNDFKTMIRELGLQFPKMLNSCPQLSQLSALFEASQDRFL